MQTEGSITSWIVWSMGFFILGFIPSAVGAFGFHVMQKMRNGRPEKQNA